MGTEVECGVQACRFYFDGRCTKGEIKIYSRQVTINYYVPACNSYKDEMEDDPNELS